MNKVVCVTCQLHLLCYRASISWSKYVSLCSEPNNLEAFMLTNNADM